MPALDNCILSIFEPGNPGNATDSGTISTPSYGGYGIAESASAADTVDAFVAQMVVEAASAADTVTAGLVYAVAVDETVTAVDSVDTTTTAAPSRSAMVAGPKPVFINPTTSRQANAGGVMVNTQ